MAVLTHASVQFVFEGVRCFFLFRVPPGPFLIAFVCLGLVGCGRRVERRRGKGDVEVEVEVEVEALDGWRCVKLLRIRVGNHCHHLRSVRERTPLGVSQTLL